MFVFLSLLPEYSDLFFQSSLTKKNAKIFTDKTEINQISCKTKTVF